MWVILGQLSGWRILPIRNKALSRSLRVSMISCGRAGGLLPSGDDQVNAHLCRSTRAMLGSRWTQCLVIHCWRAGTSSSRQKASPQRALVPLFEPSTVQCLSINQTTKLTSGSIDVHVNALYKNSQSLAIDATTCAADSLLRSTGAF